MLFVSQDKMANSTDLRPLVGKVCLVTGATRGIGKGIALQLGEAGATVYITGKTSRPPCAERFWSHTQSYAGSKEAENKTKHNQTRHHSKH